MSTQKIRGAVVVVMSMAGLAAIAQTQAAADAPWHINIGRQRLRGEDREWTIWSPTGSNFHDLMRFGRVE